MTAPSRPVRRIVVVGGGIAGLSTAYYLRRLARPDGAGASVVLLERDRRPGGKIVTHRVDGLVVEGGPDSFFNEKPQAAALCRDIGLADELLPSNDATYSLRLLWRGHLVPYPRGFRLAVPTAVGPFLATRLISPAGKLRMAMDLLLPRRREQADESLASFVRRRLGREALDRLAGPILAAIHVGDPERMSMQAILPMFLELERRFGSLIRGIRAARRARAARDAPSPMFTTLRSGMITLAERLGALLGDALQLGAEAIALNPRPGWVVRLADGRAWEADHVVLAVPPRTAAAWLAPFHAGLAAELQAIRHVSSATVSMAFDDNAVAECPDGGGFGFVALIGEPSPLMAFTWSSRKFDGRAPPGRHLVRAFVGGPGRERLALQPEADLVEMVRAEVTRLLRIRTEPSAVWVHRWPDANPQYDVGHLDRVDRIERLAADLPGLHFAGGAYRGVGIPDCIRQGRAVAERILAGA